jgi:hypothetical protein
MSNRSVAAAWGVALVVGGTAACVTTDRLECGEGDGIQLLWRHWAANVDTLAWVQYEAGAPILAVSESCEYTVYWPEYPGYPPTVRRGRLSTQEAAELGRDVGYARWEGERRRAYDGALFDGSTAEFSTPRTVFLCFGGCREGNVPKWMEDADKEATRWVRALFARSVPENHFVRVSIEEFPEPRPSARRLSAWPLEGNIENYVRRTAGPDPAGYPLVDDTEDARTLRDLTIQYASGEFGEGAWRGYGYVPFGDGQIDGEIDRPRYGMVIRDALPFEDDRGQVASPYIDPTQD